MPPGDSAEATRPDPRGPGWIGAVVVVTALVSATVTFLILAGVIQVTPTRTIGVTLLAINVALVLGLAVIIAWEARVFLKARRANAAVARLHTRIVGLFSLIAILPTILLAVVASITIDRGLSLGFTDRVRDVVLKSVEVADAYQENQCQSLAREIRILNDDLTRARPNFDVNRDWFENFLTTRATNLGLPVAQIMRGPTEVVARAKIDVLKATRLPSAAAFEEAAKSNDPICLLPTEGRVFAALLRMPAYDDAVLMVQREVSQLAIEFPGVSRAAAAEYLTYDSLRRQIQITFASIFVLIALIALLSAVWFGMNFANRFVAPIRRLINAADQVASGNFYAQVPARKSDGDLAHLGASFNKMTQELRRQHDGLTAANELIDSRRRFTEAVLSGVSPGVIGIDAGGFATIANPAAERMLDLAGEALVGQRLAQAVPELAPVLAEGESRQRAVQQQIQLTRAGRERTVTVRVTSEQAHGTARGYVVTLDDITDLVSAQRTSAWADVARRIAHEIKNPLTPIQLSAERIRRKYGKVITADREVFDQCTATIVRQVDEIKRMVDEFSSFARMPKPAIAENDLTEIAKQNLFMMRVAHPEIDFAFSTRDGAERITAAFDIRLLSQAITNILKNAVEAVIEVPEAILGKGRISLDLAVEEGFALISITDNGKGFPAEGRQRLLEPYMTTREGGTGLGLAIVSKVLEEHGGGIELNDNPTGRGGQVRMRVPRAQATDAAAGPTAQAGAGPAATETETSTTVEKGAARTAPQIAEITR
ncbi:PAS domain-containing sensor histidine kinase [Methylobacterium gregans]|uniref:histidine kinase n=1 Tax=Methylobacterium gregans TaxID=374424 RepID=A0AA37HRE9_9HYPH|nr:PAS domain-containing sensor histidine kinase [Methylobacterium gregans]MDQ0521219.1 two-component system nitrogen regulation sensor histidine kinase NtrY [Methylobacterium gregans]GJD80214.1 Adaptive-response sensory-kinase SasA [Methylobacterium gregans]GLS54385.1 PAS domain-containing sensor histidine kinase [Methylobacterium gregans]